MSTSNPYCEVLEIEVPSVEKAAESADANWYGLLIACLLEKGRPLTLEEAADRLDEAGVATARDALASLKKCKPGRPPVYRDGDLYALDPHDHEADLWAFRMGLRSPDPSPIPEMPDILGPLPSPDVPLTPQFLRSAWRANIPKSWSGLRTAICVVDAHGGIMEPSEVLAYLEKNCYASRLREDTAEYWRRDAPIQVREDGAWTLDRSHEDVRSARAAIRQRIEMLNPGPYYYIHPQTYAAISGREREERLAHAEELARMRRVLLHGVPAGAPEAAVLLDVNRRRITRLQGDGIEELPSLLDAFDILGGLGIRGMLRGLGIPHGARRLHELEPPQKSIQLNRQGRALRLTPTLLIQGSCGIDRPLSEPDELEDLLRSGRDEALFRRLEADVRSLHALYEYGRLHGHVRVRWGFLDQWIPAPWCHHDEPTLITMMSQARETGLDLEVVAEKAPTLEDPWREARTVSVVPVRGGWDLLLVDRKGFMVDTWDVQAARLAI